MSDAMICNVLQSKNWSVVLNMENINEAFSAFKDIFRLASDEVAALRQRRARVKSNSWMSDELLDLMHIRQSAYAQFLRVRSSENGRHYKQLHSLFESGGRKAKRQFFADGAKSGGKFFWSNIKLISGIRRQKRKHLPWPAATQETARCFADTLNNFFVNSVNEIVTNLPKSCVSSLSK